MLIGWQNKVDAAALTVGSEVATLPGSNVKAELMADKWGTAAGVKASYMVFDLGASVVCGLLGVFGTNLSSSATVRLRASDADPAAVGTLLYDSGLVAAGVKDGYGAIYKYFNDQAARYWRLDLADATLADNMLVGRVFLGPKWQPSVGMPYDWGITAKDPSTKTKSYGGQSFADVRLQQRVLSFTLDWMNESEMYANAFAMARDRGVVKDVLAIPFENGARISEQAVYGLIESSKELKHRASQIFRTEYTIEERL